MWCVAELNEEYVRKLEDVLELYERPYNQAEPVVCLDEKPVTLHKDVRSPKPSAPGQIAKRDSEYERCGTANVFCAVSVCGRGASGECAMTTTWPDLWDGNVGPISSL